MVKYFIHSLSLLVPRLVKADDCKVLFACLPETKNNKLFGFICVTFSEFVERGFKDFSIKYSFCAHFQAYY